MKISASIVIYNNSLCELVALINELLKNEDISKIFIVDNSDYPSQNLADISQRVEYIYTKKNLGFGKAHNIALKRSIELQCNFHIILNPDITFENVIIHTLVEYMINNRDVVYILPKVLNTDGSQQYLCKLLPTPLDLFGRRFLPEFLIRKWNSRYTLKKSGYNEILNPPCLSGCFMFLRIETIAKNNISFDDRYFMYCEDIDLIRRLHRFGKTIYFPKVSITHRHAKESYKNKKMLIYHCISACQYFFKWGFFIDRERRKWNKECINEVNKLSKSKFINTNCKWQRLQSK